MYDRLPLTSAVVLYHRRIHLSFQIRSRQNSKSLRSCLTEYVSNQMASAGAGQYSIQMAILKCTVSSNLEYWTNYLFTKLFADNWSRFLIKQTYKTLRPKRSFIEHHPAGIPIHGPKTVPNGWEWFEMGFFVHWRPPQTTTVLCFDTPEKLQSLLGSALQHRGSNIDTADPYSLLSTLIDQVIALYDESVWSMRNHVCAAEAVSLEHHHVQTHGLG